MGFIYQGFIVCYQNLGTRNIIICCYYHHEKNDFVEISKI